MIFKEFKPTIKLAWPLVLGQLGIILFSVIDTVMVGWLGVAPLGAVAFSRSFFFLFMVIGVGIGSAVGPLIAQAQGSGKPEDGGEVLRHGLIISLALALFAIGLIIFVMIPNLHRFHQPPEVIQIAQSYLKLISFGLIPIYIFYCFRQFVDGLGRTLPATVIAVIGLTLKITLNWVLIFGHFGLPAFGVTGAAISLLITQSCMAFMMTVYALGVPYTKAFRPKRWFSTLHMEWIKRVARLGIPSSMQYLFEVSAFTFAVIMMGWISANMLAAHEIAINVASITFMFALGTSFATSIRVGNAVGRDRLDQARYAGFGSMLLIMVVMSAFAVTFYVGRYFIPRLYIQDVDVIAACAPLMIMAAFFQIFDGLQSVAIGALRGLEDVKIPTLITFFAYWVMSLPVGYILAFKFNLSGVGVWIGLASGLATSACLLTWRFHKKTMLSQ